MSESEDKKSATVWHYENSLVENLKIHTSYIGGLQRITSKFILRSSEEDQQRLPQAIDKFKKVVTHNFEKDGDPDIKMDEWESDLYILFSLTQLLKFEAQEQGFATEIPVEYDSSDIQELAKQVAGGTIDADLMGKVGEIADKLKIV